MQRIIFCSLFCFLFFQQAGCRTTIVCSNKIEAMADIPRLHHSDPEYNSVVEDTPGTNLYCVKAVTANLPTQKTCRIKYHPSHYTNRWMVVEGRLNNGRKYPLILDTGASVALFVNDIHIMENKLPIHPVQSSNEDTAGWGICRLPKMHVGDVTLNGWPCFYREQHTEVRLLGLDMSKDKTMIAGLPILRSFKYIMFDSITGEVELSLHRSFVPEHAETWTTHPMRIEEDQGGNVFLFVEISICGYQIELQLDTGSGNGLAICERSWDKLNSQVEQVRLRSGKDLYPYVGLLSCKKAIVPRIEIGGRVVTGAHISIFPNESPIMENCSGILGMQYFEDTAMVLDFERNLLWVRNS